MDSMLAFEMGRMNRGRELMVFDWDKAAELIKERKPEYAAAGLQGDWEWTGGIIYSSGKIVTNDYTYLASTWATPELELDNEIIECYKMQSEVPQWSAKTKWPNSARTILESEENYE